MAKKATNYEIIQRVRLIVDFLLDGLSRYEIQQYATKEWKLSSRPIDQYIQYANKRIERMARKDEQKAFDKIRVRLERQYRRSVQGNDGRLALLLLDRMCKLYGLDKPVKVVIKGEIGLHPIQKQMESLSDKDLIALAGDTGVVVPMKLIGGKKKKSK